MKTLIFLLCFLLTGSNATDESLTWNESVKLSWSDFKAKPDANNDEVALTASGITFGFAVKTSGNKIVDFSTTVYAQFYPSKSWYLKKKGTAHILGHEQLHFDITELYARQFRQQLLALKVNQKVKSQMKKLHASVNKALNEEQKRYDLETRHSMNLEKQKEWETNIQKELNKLKEFKSS
ncbi:DUF922 domain-containing protein [Winogradskyella wichelsiae]|uniref:DUF922 domain-containing protein n=1 Tax=Winogradskyella wichelsiae TaxID=2697007 RepID=UPI003EF8E30F